MDITAYDIILAVDAVRQGKNIVHPNLYQDEGKTAHPRIRRCVEGDIDLFLVSFVGSGIRFPPFGVSCAVSGWKGIATHLGVPPEELESNSYNPKLFNPIHLVSIWT